MNRNRLLLINTGSNLIYYFINLIVVIILFPIKIHYFGNEIYGVYLLISGVLALLSKTDFGIGSTIVKYSSELIAQKKRDELLGLYSSSFFFNIIIGLLLGLMIIVIGYHSNYIFHLENQEYSIFYQLSIILGVVFFLNRMLSCNNAIILGMQKYFLFNIFGIIITLSNLLVVNYIVKNEKTIVDFVFISSILSILPGIIFSFYVYIINPRLRFVRFKWEEIRRYFIFAISMIKSQIASIIMFEADKIILGIFTNPISITYYSVGQKTHSMVRAIYNSFRSALLPLLSEKIALNDKNYVKKSIYKGTRLLSLVWYPIIIISICNIKNILRIWLGQEYEFLWLFSILFLSIYIVIIPSGVIVQAYIAKGKISKYMNIKLFAGFLNLIISIILVQFYGIWGVLIGTLVQCLLFQPVFYKLFFSELNIKIDKFSKEVLKPVIIILFVSIIISIILKKIISPDSLFQLAFQLIVSILCIYTSLIFIFKEDTKFILKVIGMKKE